MTGFGRGEAVFEGRTITVELRSVNSRYFECNIRSPRHYMFLEEGIKAALQRQIARGKVDVFVSLEGTERLPVGITINHPVVEAYLRAYEQLAETYQLTNDLSLSHLAKLPDVLSVEETCDDVQQIGAKILSVLEEALTGFSAMRQREGRQLKEDILARCFRVEALVGQIEVCSPASVAEYRQKLETRMGEFLENAQMEPARILAEAALFADKVAVAEETVRIDSHLSQLRAMLMEEGAVGRKLDFLIQELNREANTIGSKSNDLEICRLVVDMKAEIEKIREQTQNIE